MSLDVYLQSKSKHFTLGGDRFFIREDGETRAITREEWDRRFPDREPVTMTEVEDNDEVYWANITHNLGAMARAAGIYSHLWRPEEIEVTTAGQLIEPLAAGLERLKADPDHFKTFNAANGWGLYEHFVRFVDEYLTACRAYPHATIRVSR